MNYVLKPNFKVVGKVFGSNLKEYQEKLLSLSLEDVKHLENNETIKMNVNGDDYEVTSEMVDIRISAKEGFNVGMENNNFVILNATLTDELVKEGIAREVVSKVQLMRKNNGLELTDRIVIKYSADELICNAIEEFSDYIKHETLADELINSEVSQNEFVIDDKKIAIEISKK